MEDMRRNSATASVVGVCVGELAVTVGAQHSGEAQQLADLGITEVDDRLRCFEVGLAVRRAHTATHHAVHAGRREG